MKPSHLPSGRQRGIAFMLADDWTPAEALAVLELLDDLRERICAHYQFPLHELLRQQRQPREHDDPIQNMTDPPF